MMAGRKANFLDYVPIKKIPCRKETDGQMVLMLPKFGNGVLGRWWSSVVGQHRSVLKIHLDELGRMTWEAIDGKRSIGDIADHVQYDSPTALDGHYERCSRFMKMLSNAGAVELKRPLDDG